METEVLNSWHFHDVFQYYYVFVLCPTPTHLSFFKPNIRTLLLKSPCMSHLKNMPSYLLLHSHPLKSGQTNGISCVYTSNCPILHMISVII